MQTKLNNLLAAVLMLLFIAFSLTNVIAQAKSKKQQKEAQKFEKQKQIALLVESKKFVFAAVRVIPQTRTTLILTSEFDVAFQPDLITSFLPFIGRGFCGIGYGGDEGMKFEGKPTLFQVEKTQIGYQIKVEVRGKTDVYAMMLSVYDNGSAYLSINSNNRSPISYDGHIQVFKKE